MGTRRRFRRSTEWRPRDTVGKFGSYRGAAIGELSVRRRGVMQINMLRMFRRDAAQHYPIKLATWGFSEPTPYSVPVLSLAVETERQQSIFPEDDQWPQTPGWRLDIWTRGLSDSMLVTGCQFSIPECYDDFTGVTFTAFYYDEMEGTEANLIKIIRREGDFLDLSIEGFIRHEHASMRPTHITVDARFTKRTPHEEINAKFGGREELPPHEPPYGATHLPPDAA